MWHLEVIEQLDEQLGPFKLHLRSTTASPLVPFPGPPGPVENPDRLDVEAHEKEHAPHDRLFNWVGSWLLFPHHLYLLWCDIVETPAGLIDGDSQWPTVLIEVVCRIFCD